jgi:HEXXH motif-containing protein
VRAIETAWPEGANNLALLTSRIIPLQARGVVSFSYRHRPGLSFINCFDRDEFDLIDDLIHENSHHQLNLYLRKAELLRGEHTDEIFYSPWRKSLRPVRGILHATFTFTMGALLFDRLAVSHRVTDAHRLRAQARCLEEVESVRYSLRDLVYAARQLGWLSESGVALVQSMAREIRRVHRRIALHESAIYSSHYGQDLKRHCDTLRHARHNYGPRL